MEYIIYLFISTVFAGECKRNEMECMGSILRTCTDDGYWTEMPCPDGTNCSVSTGAVSCKRTDRADAGVLIDSAMQRDKKRKLTTEGSDSESNESERKGYQSKQTKTSKNDSESKDEFQSGKKQSKVKPSRSKMNGEEDSNNKIELQSGKDQNEVKSNKKSNAKKRRTNENSSDSVKGREKTVTITRPLSEEKNDDGPIVEKTITITKIPKEIDLEIDGAGNKKDNFKFSLKTEDAVNLPQGRSTVEYQVNPQGKAPQITSNPTIQQPSNVQQGSGSQPANFPGGQPSQQSASTPSQEAVSSQAPQQSGQQTSSQGSQQSGQQNSGQGSQQSGQQTSSQGSQQSGQQTSGQGSQQSGQQTSGQGAQQSGQQNSGQGAQQSGQSSQQSSGQASQQSGQSAQQPSSEPGQASQKPSSPTTSPAATSGQKQPQPNLKQQDQNKSAQGNKQQSSTGAKSSESSQKSSSEKSASSAAESSSGSQSSGGQAITTDQLSKAMKEEGFSANPSYVAAVVKGVNAKYKDKEMVAMLLAQLAHESGGFIHLEEIACKGNKCAGKYDTGGLPGKSYHGRGFIQLTWPDNYKKASAALGMGDKLYKEPESVAKDVDLAVKTSMWYWDAIVLAAPGVKDKKQFGLTTKAINGPIECGKGQNAQAEKRYKIYKTIAKNMGITNLAANTGC